MDKFYHSSIDSELSENDLTIEARLEALLFVSPSPVSLSQLSNVLEVSIDEIERGLQSLDKSYSHTDSKRGLRLQFFGKQVQMTTSPELAQDIEKLFGLEIQNKLSKAALETLAIIAYKEPVTRPEIDSIRGVNSDGVLKSLLHKELIMETGRADSVGRPILYKTTTDFLQHFGLSSLEDLPELDFSQESSS